MAYLNKVMLIGNIGKEPAIATTQNGKKRASFSLATSRRYRDNNGEQKEQTDWHNIVVWGKTVDVMEQLGVTKGSTIYVEGVLTNRSWTDQATGQKRYSTEVNLENFQLLSSRNQQNNQGNQNAYSSNASPAQRQMGIANDDGYYASSADEDLPF